ncbi:cytochrome P450 [Rickenella mellea]|uniref:Cytochrome P450 n=1 Tax=Rickenella mellea TaxID=50990 RepID=A0A4Y7QL49_9AGAM|nr:cytochrome P450 [Rickenella mellea]
MSSSAFPGLFCLIVALLLVKHLTRLWTTSNGHPLPPGPPAEPFIGHIRILPSQYQWKTFAELGRKYGDIVYMHIFGRPMIVLNSILSATELMVERGANYSDRPRLVLLSEIMSWDSFLTFLPYGDRFRKYRRLMQQHFNSTAVNKFKPLQIEETHRFLKNMLDSPEQFERHIHLLNASTMMMVTYGHRVTTESDEYVRTAERAIELTVEAGSPGTHLVDFVPWLRFLPTWMPGAAFKRYAFKIRRLVRDMLDIPVNRLKEDMASKTARPSFASALLNAYEQQQTVDYSHEEDIKGVTAGIFGGMNLTQAVLMSFVLAMVLHPEAAAKAQKEIDAIVGHDRLPDFHDREYLPFVDCVMKETLRWNTPVPLGIPHRAMNSDIYRGKCIPAGTMVIANIWKMMRDEQFYLEPERFQPERFQCADSRNATLDPKSAIFGFGRRVCPGRFFSDNGIWLAMVCLLATFDFLPPIDDDGREVMPKPGFQSGFTSHPMPFKCRISRRSERAALLVRQAPTEQ